MGMTVLFFLAILILKPAVNKANIQTKAEYIIKVTWNDVEPLTMTDDVDAWVETPTGDVVFFKEKYKGLIHLDRDDLGWQNDDVVLRDGTRIKYKYNQEIITLREIIPGEFIVNVHMYNKHNPDPTEILVEITKLNPTAITILRKTFTMIAKGEEITVLRFTLSKSGEVMHRDDTFKSLTEGRLMTYSGTENRGDQ
jgi:hypothetical protein